MIYKINSFNKNLFLLLNKNKKITSNKLIQKLKKYFILKIGHSGTLDPSAFGLLIICVGKYVNLLRFLSLNKKKYLVFCIFGVKSDSLDIDGKILYFFEKKIKYNKFLFKNFIKSFNKLFLQDLPEISSIKHNNINLYKYSRLELKINTKPKLIKIFKFNIINVYKNILITEIECSKGSYIRSIINKLGLKINVPVTVLKIVRLKSGKFNILNSVNLF